MQKQKHCEIKTEEELNYFIHKHTDMFLKKKHILLKGEIGAGKTTFARYFINCISTDKQIVTSPTFSLITNYDTLQGLLYHMDLYRLNKITEIISLGIEEILAEDHLCLIEWPQLLIKYKLVCDYTLVEIVKRNNNTRELTISTID